MTDHYLKLPNLPRRRTRRYKSHSQVTDDLSNSEDEQHTESSLSENSEHNERRHIESLMSEDESESDDYLVTESFEDYSPPKYEPYQDEKEEVKIDDQFAWILLWIMNFRIRFNIPETATESLIKFMKLVLTEIGCDKFNRFPSTLYLAKKSLGLKDRFHSFVPCTKCHKLYNRDEVVNFRQNDTLSIIKCNHVEFPNSSIRRLRPCNTPLSRKMDNSNFFQPKLIHPFASIREQLGVMFRRQGFENYLRYWANRTSFNNILADIYDGQVWKTFKENGSEISPKFFRPDVADSHLGLMMNLD